MWLNPPTPGPKPRGPEGQGSGRGPKQDYSSRVFRPQQNYGRKNSNNNKTALSLVLSTRTFFSNG